VARLAHCAQEGFIACRQVVGVDTLPECGQAGQGIGYRTAPGQQGADEGTCGRSHDCLGSRQVDTDLAQPCEQTDLPTDTDGAAATEDESACRRVVPRRIHCWSLLV
jgi:hypothetical protein